MARDKRGRCPICAGHEFVDAIDNEGESYIGCAHCLIVDSSQEPDTLEAPTLSPEELVSHFEECTRANDTFRHKLASLIGDLNPTELSILQRRFKNAKD
jgi:hypothetical protein